MRTAVDSGVDLFQIGGERNHQVHFLAELVDGEPVLRAQDRLRKFPRGCEFQRQVFARAQAGVDRERDRERKRRLTAEDGDLLIFAVFLELKVFFFKSGDRRTVRIGDRHEDIDQFDIDLDCAARILREQREVRAVEQCAGEQAAYKSRDSIRVPRRAAKHMNRKRATVICSQLAARGSWLSIHLNLRDIYLDAVLRSVVLPGR